MPLVRAVTPWTARGDFPNDATDKTNILPTKHNANLEAEESGKGDVKASIAPPSITTLLIPETDIERADERRMLHGVAVTHIDENLRAMRLPLLMELAKRLKGDVKAVDRITLFHGQALGVFQGGNWNIGAPPLGWGPNLHGFLGLSSRYDEIHSPRKTITIKMITRYQI